MQDCWATVIAVDADGERAMIRSEQVGCGRCAEPGGCGGVHLGQALCVSQRHFPASNPERCAVGERVRVCVDDGVVGRSAWHAYLLPLLALLAGAATGSLLAGETGAMLGSLAGLALGWFSLRRTHRHWQRQRHWQLTIRR